MPDCPSFSPESHVCLSEGRAGVCSLVSLWQEGCAAVAGCRARLIRGYSWTVFRIHLRAASCPMMVALLTAPESQLLKHQEFMSWLQNSFFKNLY